MTTPMKRCGGCTVTIERFTKEQFEQSLPVDKETEKRLWEYYGFDKGGHCYLVRINNGNAKRAAILVRSSVGADGVSAGTGEDSIRLYLVNAETGQPLAKKVDAWTTRVIGWRKRMTNKIRELYGKGLRMKNCPKCNGVMLQRTGRFGEFYGCSNYPQCKHTVDSLEELNEQPDALDALDEVLDTPHTAVQEPKKIQEPNAQQKAYIEAPIDANMRVLAAPGSGKTFSTIERILYLMEHGVPADNIVYVTFTKTMAEEGYERILQRAPHVADTRLAQQICTIHALCYRILTTEGYELNVPKEWEVKRSLQEIIEGNDKNKIEGLWQHYVEKPGWKEVLYYISNAKFHALTESEDHIYFSRALPRDHAQRVDKARSLFDAWLRDNKYITFDDMLFLVEQKLLRDSEFRERWQARFTHVLVDEAQDTSEQALRVLITLSLEPGDNRLYDEFLRRGM